MPITDARRAFLANEWREVTSEDDAVRTAYPLAVETIEETLYQTADDATTEAARRQVMRSIPRHRYELVVRLDDETSVLDLGDVVQITHTRYGLSAGKLFRIIGVEPDTRSRTLTLQVWGPSDPTSLVRVRPVLSGTGTGVTPDASQATISVRLVGTGTTT